MLNEELIHAEIDKVLGLVEANLLKKSSLKEESGDEEANGGKEEVLSQGCSKAEKKDDDEDEDEDEDEDDEDEVKKSITLAMEGFSALVKAFGEKVEKKKKKKKEKEDDKEDHKDVAIDHVCDNKDKDVHKEIALEHMKKSFSDEIDLLKSEIEKLKATPIPQKGIPAGVQPLKKSAEGGLSKAEVLSELLTLKKANPDSVDSKDIMSVEQGKADPQQILLKYKKG